MLWIISEQPIVQPLSHHRGIERQMYGRRSAIRQWTRIQFGVNRVRVINDAQLGATGQRSEIARLPGTRATMKELRPKSFHDAVGITNAQLMFVDQQTICRRLSFEKGDSAFNSPNKPDKRGGQEWDNAQMGTEDGDG